MVPAEVRPDGGGCSSVVFLGFDFRSYGGGNQNLKKIWRCVEAAAPLPDRGSAESSASLQQNLRVDLKWSVILESLERSRKMEVFVKKCRRLVKL